MSSNVARDIYDGLKKIITMEDRISQSADSAKQADVILHDHAERLARMEGKFEILENTLAASPRYPLDQSPYTSIVCADPISAMPVVRGVCRGFAVPFHSCCPSSLSLFRPVNTVCGSKPLSENRSARISIASLIPRKAGTC
jgi:hypothetical protein